MTDCEREKLVGEMARAMHDDYPHPMRQDPWDELTDVGKRYWIGKADAALAAFLAIIEERAGPDWMIVHYRDGRQQYQALAELLEDRDAD